MFVVYCLLLFCFVFWDTPVRPTSMTLQKVALIVKYLNALAVIDWLIN